MSNPLQNPLLTLLQIPQQSIGGAFSQGFGQGFDKTLDRGIESYFKQQELQSKQKQENDLALLSAPSVLNRLDELIHAPGLGIGSLNMSDEARRNRAELDTLKLQIEGIIRPMVQSGRITEQQYQTIMERLPKRFDSESAMEGKMLGIRRIVESLLKGKTPDFGESQQKTSLSKKAISNEVSIPTNEIRINPKTKQTIAKKNGKWVKVHKIEGKWIYE